MIQRTALRTIVTKEELSWQEELQQLITDPESLFTELELDPSLLPAARKAHALFPVRATPSYISRIEKGNISDPLLRQILPLGEESTQVAGYSNDPLEEHAFNPNIGIVHKYKNRVLLIATSHCAINCRYCFRRAFDYSGNRLSKQDWLLALDYIRNDSAISEVILSGGDPLSLSDSHLEWLLTHIAAIPHVERVRVHSRLPIVLPARVSSDVLSLFTATRLQAIWVVHSNHPNEIDDAVGKSLLSIRAAGITLLNQSVLLKGVNDDANTLCTLSNTLFRHDVIPYYLHLLDKVNGASHFDMSETDALAIYASMRDQLSGYLLPKLVREVPGTLAKQAVY